MADKKKYDSTVARIAGNVASGIAARIYLPLNDTMEQQQAVAIAARSVVIARAIVAEVARTEPKAAK